MDKSLDDKVPTYLPEMAGSAYDAVSLRDLGLAHRISRLNAFMACTHPSESHSPAFFICRDCNAVAEVSGQTARAAVARLNRCEDFTMDFKFSDEQLAIRDAIAWFRSRGML